MHRAEHRAEQIARVDAYKAWLNAGMPVGEIPPVPRDCDFVQWREAQDATLRVGSQLILDQAGIAA